MKLYIENLVNGKVEVKLINDKRYLIKTFCDLKEISFCLSGGKTTILDENGKYYVLSFCCIEENRNIDDYFVSFSYGLKMNEKQANVFKNLIGLIEKDESFFKRNWKEKTKAFQKIEKILSSLGSSINIFYDECLVSDNFQLTTYSFFEEINDFEEE